MPRLLPGGVVATDTPAPAPAPPSCDGAADEVAVSERNYTGVYWDKKRKKWKAILWCEGAREELGRYDKKLDAARAYDRRVRADWRLVGRAVNFPSPGETRPRSIPRPRSGVAAVF